MSANGCLPSCIEEAFRLGYNADMDAVCPPVIEAAAAWSVRWWERGHTHHQLLNRVHELEHENAELREKVDPQLLDLYTVQAMFPDRSERFTLTIRARNEGDAIEIMRRNFIGRVTVSSVTKEDTPREPMSKSNNKYVCTKCHMDDVPWGDGGQVVGFSMPLTHAGCGGELEIVKR